MRLKQFTDSVTGIGRSALSISFRLLIFNILLVFLPIAAVLYLDIYEEQLLISQEKTMVQQGRLLSASLSGKGKISPDEVSHIFNNLANRTETRLRVVDKEGWLLGDTSSFIMSTPREVSKVSRDRYSASAEFVDEVLDRDSLLYRMATYPVVLYRKLFNPPIPVDQASFYSSTTRFQGREVLAALEGKYGAATRLSPDKQRSVTLYTAIPVYSDREVVGAVLSSQSTYRILKDLYEIRLFILRIFLTSLAAAVIISIFLSGTISSRIKKLGEEARAIRTGKGRIKGSFTHLKLNDEIGFLSLSLIDLTDRLDRHIQFIDSLSRDMSHEFKNPLAVIRSATEMINSSDGEQRQRFLDLIDQNSRRMESLLNGVEEISRLDSHLDKEKKVKLDISKNLSTLLEGFRLRYPELNWHINSRPTDLCLLASEERLSQVFVNLYENAASFSEKEGSVVTRVNRNKNHVLVSIYNDGPLIPQEDLENIINRFFTTREKGKERHHGLGLSIVKTIVESYGGSVKVFNSLSGVTFSIVLPLVPCK